LPKKRVSRHSGPVQYSPEYDRLLVEARALAAAHAAAADGLPASGLTPRERAQHGEALLALRARLSAVLAGIADGQAGAAGAWQPAQWAQVGQWPELGAALASLEQRLAAVRG
jgi:hypothetical protein